jgi:hypothetical protein
MPLARNDGRTNAARPELVCLDNDLSDKLRANILGRFSRIFRSLLAQTA